MVLLAYQHLSEANFMPKQGQNKVGLRLRRWFINAVAQRRGGGFVYIGAGRPVPPGYPVKMPGKGRGGREISKNVYLVLNVLS